MVCAFDSGDAAVDEAAAGPTLAAAAAAAASAFAHDDRGGTVFGVAGVEAPPLAVDGADRDIPAVFPSGGGAARPLLVFWFSVPVLRAAIRATADHNSFDLIGGKGASVHWF